MNYYISEIANAAGSHGPLHNNPAAGRVCLPEALYDDYLAARGFVTLTVDAGHVLHLAPDAAARAAYEASHPEPAPTPSLEQRMTSLEETVRALPEGGSGGVWHELAAAYREGIQSA